MTRESTFKPLAAWALVRWSPCRWQEKNGAIGLIEAFFQQGVRLPGQQHSQFKFAGGINPGGDEARRETSSGSFAASSRLGHRTAG